MMDCSQPQLAKQNSPGNDLRRTTLIISRSAQGGLNLRVGVCEPDALRETVRNLPGSRRLSDDAVVLQCAIHAW